MLWLLILGGATATREVPGLKAPADGLEKPPLDGLETLGAEGMEKPPPPPDGWKPPTPPPPPEEWEPQPPPPSLVRRASALKATNRHNSSLKAMVSKYLYVFFMILIC